MGCRRVGQACQPAALAYRPVALGYQPVAPGVSSGFSAGSCAHALTPSARASRQAERGRPGKNITGDNGRARQNENAKCAETVVDFPSLRARRFR